MPQSQRFPFRDVARYAPFPLVGGALMGGAIRGQWTLPVLAHGALIGFSCFALSVFGEHLLHGWIERRRDQWWRRALVYFVASQIAWPIALVAGGVLLWGRAFHDFRLPPTVWFVVIGLSALGTLGGLAAYGYEELKERLLRSVEQLKEKEFADKELALARELQSRMLPAPEIAADGYRISCRNLAARTVAGDFYDVFQYGDGAIGIAIADVAGKGIAASLIMASVKAVLPLMASTRTVEETMNALNDKLAGELSKREFVALALARYEPGTGGLSFVNAGLPDPYLLRRGAADPVVVSGPRLPLGLKRSLRYEASRLFLQPGESLLFLSDGLPEATGLDGELLGYERLRAILCKAGPRVDAILQQVQAATTPALDDDQTVVILERAATEGVTS